MSGYIGRFAPSPTGRLHAGSIVAALASWLDARAHGGQWRVRMEDVDGPRCIPGADRQIMAQLAALGLHPDGEVMWQSRRGAAYAEALERLKASGAVYPCRCTRREIEEALVAAGRPPQRHGERVYPGTCRTGLAGGSARAWRLRAGTEAHPIRIAWDDRRLGLQAQDLTHEVGDFVLHRADGAWTYQLAVVVDDAAQGITHVVRGEDLADNTARQIHLQRQLGFSTPVYLHTPLVCTPEGEKLSKQTGAAPVDTADPLTILRRAAQVLDLPAALSAPSENMGAGPAGRNASDPLLVDWLAAAVQAWAERWH